MITDDKHGVWGQSKGFDCELEGIDDHSNHERRQESAIDDAIKDYEIIVFNVTSKVNMIIDVVHLENLLYLCVRDQYHVDHNIDKENQVKRVKSH